jgi:hypothetical protein
LRQVYKGNGRDIYGTQNIACDLKKHTEEFELNIIHKRSCIMCFTFTWTDPAVDDIEAELFKEICDFRNIKLQELTL